MVFGGSAVHAKNLSQSLNENGCLLGSHFFVNCGLKVVQENGQGKQNKASQDEPEGVLCQDGDDAQLGKQACYCKDKRDNKSNKFWCGKFHNKLLLIKYERLSKLILTPLARTVKS